jgi:hypothetical protein
MSNIPRPKNSFMIWSSSYRKQINLKYSILITKEKKNNYLLSLLNNDNKLYNKIFEKYHIDFNQVCIPNNLISILLGVIWDKTIDFETKKKYIILANQEKEYHKKLYPFYRYQPKQKKKRKREYYLLNPKLKVKKNKIEELEITYVDYGPDYGPDFREFAYMPYGY